MVRRPDDALHLVAVGGPDRPCCRRFVPAPLVGPDAALRGNYVAVDSGERLGFTWSRDHDDLPPRPVIIGFAASDRGTIVSVDHEAESAEEGSDCVDGWTHFLGWLDARLNGG